MTFRYSIEHELPYMKIVPRFFWTSNLMVEMVNFDDTNIVRYDAFGHYNNGHLDVYIENFTPQKKNYEIVLYKIMNDAKITLWSGVMTGYDPQ